MFELSFSIGVFYDYCISNANIVLWQIYFDALDVHSANSLVWDESAQPWYRLHERSGTMVFTRDKTDHFMQCIADKGCLG